MIDKKVMIIAITVILIVAVVAVLGFSGVFNLGSDAGSETISITVTSVPTGSGYIKVDGTAIVTPTTFQWKEGSTHTLQVASSEGETADVRYNWVSWSNGGAQTHDYKVPSSSETITANYDAQYKVSFTQTGLDSSTDENVVTIRIDGSSQNCTYTDLPFSSWMNTGDQITYTFESNVSTTVPGAFFMLSNSESSSTVSISEPTTITGAYTRTIIDANGNPITVPNPSEIDRIADSWPAHNTIVVMVGAKEKLVATATTNTQNAMFQKILPGIENMLTPFNSDGTVNLEELMAEDPDIVFTYASGGEDAAVAMENSGLLVVRLQFYDFEDMIHTVHLTGWILGEEALAKAVTYIDYFDGVIDKVTTITSQIPTEDRPLVLHITGTSPSPLSIDAGGGLINTWINLCGGNNAAAEVSGNMVTVTFEEILDWNPDIILIGYYNANEMKDQLLNDEMWSEITAVKNGDVIANPMGVFDWARYSVEEALNIQWVSQTLHPDLFADIDIRAETRDFYQNFYEYTLSDAELDAILR